MKLVFGLFFNEAISLILNNSH